MVVRKVTFSIDSRARTCTCTCNSKLGVKVALFFVSGGIAAFHQCSANNPPSKPSSTCSNAWDGRRHHGLAPSASACSDSADIIAALPLLPRHKTLYHLRRLQVIFEASGLQMRTTMIAHYGRYSIRRTSGENSRKNQNSS